MKYCDECGTKLIKKVDGIDGEVDYCPTCHRFKYPTFNSAISTLVIKDDQVLLIQQYGKEDHILVAGYIAKGENAKETLIREVKEETNLEVVDYLYNDNFYYERTNTLMHNYICYVKGDLKLTNEVDHAEFYSFKEAYQLIKPSSLAKKFFFLAMLKLGHLEDLIVYNDGIQIYDYNEKLIVHYNDKLHYIDEKYSYLDESVEHLYTQK